MSFVLILTGDVGTCSHFSEINMEQTLEMVRSEKNRAWVHWNKMDLLQ